MPIVEFESQIWESERVVKKRRHLFELGVVMLVCLLLIVFDAFLHGANSAFCIFRTVVRHCNQEKSPKISYCTLEE